MEKDHGFLSMMFGATAAGKVLEQSANMPTFIAPDDPVIYGACFFIGSIVGGLAGYNASYYLNKLIKQPEKAHKIT